MRTRHLWLAALIMVVAGCTSSDKPSPTTSTISGQTVVDVTLIQINDVYELTPVNGGAEGGLARLATLRKQLEAKNPNTFMVLAGDLVSPSALGTATVDGDRLAGRQMIDVMNLIGLDYATFGNHEFDISEDRLAKRVEESKFTWFSSNVDDANGQPLFGVPRNVVLTVKNADGKEVRIGLFGLTSNANRASYVSYRDPVEVAKRQVTELRGKADVVIAVTHLAVEDDIRVVQSVPGIDLVVGGHEHENTELRRGHDFTPIAKADANARTAQIHELRYDPSAKRLTIESRLQRITADLPDDPDVAKDVERWRRAAFDGFKSQGFDPERVVAKVQDPLDGREASVRNRPTNLSELIARGMLRAAPGTELAVFNSGSIRLDDELPPGDVTEYDIIRVMPFSDTVVSAQLKGSLLQRVLDQGQANAGTGGYLQTANVARQGDQWMIGPSPLDPARVYSVAVNSFLLSGREIKLDFLTSQNPDVSQVTEHGDIRKALIAELGS